MQLPLNHAVSAPSVTGLAAQTVTHVPGQKCYPCPRLHSDLTDHRGQTRFRVRGLERVLSVLTLCVRTDNLLRASSSLARSCCLPQPELPGATALPPSEADGVVPMALDYRNGRSLTSRPVIVRRQPDRFSKSL